MNGKPVLEEKAVGKPGDNKLRHVFAAFKIKTILLFVADANVVQKDFPALFKVQAPGPAMLEGNTVNQNVAATF